MENDVTKISEEKRFKILVCIDGTEESYRGLRYAMRLGSGTDANITLLYIRQLDKEMYTGGFDMRMARENMLEWGLELPGMVALKRARDILIDAGYLDEGWRSKSAHVDIQGDPLGDNLVEYTSDEGVRVTLKLMVSPSADIGILDECDLGNYDITILSAADPKTRADKARFFNDSISQVVATEAKNTVIVAKALEESHGHLLCLNGSNSSLKAVKRDALLASRCLCPIYLYSVVKDESEVEQAKRIIAQARKIIEDIGYGVSGEKVAVGDIAACIVEEGQNYSLIVVSGEHKPGFKRFFKSSLIYRILDAAQSSVMISR